MPAAIVHLSWLEIGVLVVAGVIILGALIADEIRRQKRDVELMRWREHANRYHDRPHD